MTAETHIQTDTHDCRDYIYKHTHTHTQSFHSVPMGLEGGPLGPPKCTQVEVMPRNLVTQECLPYWWGVPTPCPAAGTCPHPTAFSSWHLMLTNESRNVVL